ncbi:MAG: PAS domain S-box protein [bacterium]
MKKDIGQTKTQLLNELTKLKIRIAELEKTTSKRNLRKETGFEYQDRIRKLFLSLNEAFYLAQIIYDNDDTPCDYRYLEVNNAFAKLINLQRKEIIGKRYKEIVTVDTTDWLQTFIKVATTGIPVKHVFYSPEYNKYFETIAFKPGENLFAAIVSDITENKLAEQQLKRLTEQYRELFENSGTNVIIIDKQGNYLMVNKNAAANFGLPPDKIIGKSMTELLPPATAQKYLSLNRQLLKSGGSRVYEDSFQLSTGNRWFLIIDQCLKDEKGRNYAVQSSSIDITDRKTTEAKLRVHEEQYRVLYENTGTAMLIVEDDMMISLVNSQFCKLIGYSKKALEGKKRWTDFVVPEDVPWMVKQHRLRREKPEGALRQYEFRLINKEHQIRNIFLNVDIIPGTKQSIASLIDITELKHTEEELRKQKDAEQLFQQQLIMLHQVRNDLINTTTIDELCRRAIELGKTRLGFDRLGIWLNTNTPHVLSGSFGIDEKGNLRDERNQRVTIKPNSTIGRLLKKKQFVYSEQNVPLLNHQAKEIGKGTHLVAGLWDGKQLLGFLSADNLLGKKLFSHYAGELLGIYASTVGQLYTRKQAEVALQEKNEQITLLNLVSQVTIESRTPEELVDRLVETIRQVMPCDAAYVDAFDETNLLAKGVRSYDTINGVFSLVPAGTARVNPHGTVDKVIFFQRKPVRILRANEPQKGMYMSPFGDKERRSASLLYAPMIARDKVIGSISVQSYTHNAYSEKEERLLSEIARQVGSAFESIKLYSETKQAEETLRKSELQFRLIWENSTDALRLTDAQGTMLQVNEAFCRMVDKPKEELEGKPLAIVYPADRFEYNMHRHRERYQTKTVKPHYEQEMTFWNGKKVFLEIIHTFFEIEGQTILLLTSYRDITARKQVEEMLRTNEEKMRSIMDNIGIGVALISPKMEILELNLQMRKWFPLIDAAQHPTCYYAFNDPPREAPCDYCPTYKTLQDGLVHEATTHTPQAGCIVRNYRIISSPILNKAGEVTAAIEMVEDITDRIQAEEKLHHIERLYQNAIIQTGSVVYQRDYSSQNYAFMSEGILALTGYTVEEFTGQLFISQLRKTEAYGPDKDLPHEERVRRSRAGLITYWHEDYLFEKKDGALVWLSDVSVPLYDTTGKPIGSLGILTDISDRKRAEETLRLREATIRSVFKAAPVGICVMKDRRYQSANDHWCKSFGYSEEELIGNTTRMLYENEEEYQRVGQLLHQSLQEKDVVTINTRLRRKDGVFRDVILSTASLQPHDLSTGVVVIIHDVTESKEATEKIYNLYTLIQAIRKVNETLVRVKEDT